MYVILKHIHFIEKNKDNTGYINTDQVSRREEEENRVKEDLGRSIKYGKKESGHERKSPEGLAMLGYRGVANTLQ